MEFSLLSRITLYVIIGLLGLFGLAILWWQVNVLRGRSMSNPDGTSDNWHEEKHFFGIAVADIFLAIPVTLAGICLILADFRIGFYLTSLGSFWYLWANIMTTTNSLKFENPKITFSWIMVFPFEIVLALAYLVWTLIHFNEVF